MHVSDDRGRRVRLIPYRKLGVLRAIPSPIPIEARLKMYADGQEVQWSREVLITLVAGLLGLFLWAVLWFYLAPRANNWFSAPPMVKGAVMGFVPALPLPILLYIVIRVSRHRMARIVVQHGYCASCGYALEGLEPAEDHCVVCPECGAAWRAAATRNA